MAEYAHPEVLVSTDWVAQHSADPNVRLVEVDVDTRAYDDGHPPGAMAWIWNHDLCDTVIRDIAPKEKFEWLMTKSGIDNETTVVLYGDNNNWFAAWAFWELKIYGHADVRIMDGGRKKWLAEGRNMDTKPYIAPPGKAPYRASDPDFSIRAFLTQVQQAQKTGSAILLDNRSPQEFTGELLAPPGLPESCQRGGHIPGAHGVCWSRASNEDGTFKPADELWKIYGAAGITQSTPVITYCRIGERSSHTWFALKYLLGVANVANYDGSWTEWGNLVGAPVEQGATPQHS
jgi:thiosulfate/3-mercaptopyruvate sulfurtransferase